MRTNDEWPDLISRYRSRRNLTQAAFADSINVTQQTVSRWESGKQTPDPVAQQLLRSVMGLTALSSKAAWQRRVSLAWGAEALFEKGWRFLAISPKLQQSWGQPDDDIVGKVLFDLPAFRSEANLLGKLPLFDGTIRVAKGRADLYLHGNNFQADIDMWPILTCDDEIILHIVAYAGPVSKAEPGFVGVRLRDFYAVMTDGRVISTGTEAAAI
jgi:transcriptional regulator with XRE-family HTH domain